MGRITVNGDCDANPLKGDPNSGDSATLTISAPAAALAEETMGDGEFPKGLMYQHHGPPNAITLTPSELPD